MSMMPDKPNDIRSEVWINPFETCDCDKNCTHGGGLHSYEDAYRKVLDFLRPDKILEWGPGLNTKMGLEYGADVYSIEYQKKYVPTNIASDKWEYGLIPKNDDAFVQFPEGRKDWDVYFVDSRRRQECITLALQGKEDAVVCLHDAQRERYHPYLGQFKYVKFLDKGFAIASNNDRILGITPPKVINGVGILEDNMKFEHFLLTRFNTRWRYEMTDEWLEDRCRIFEAICLPSVLRQDVDFKWVISFSIDTPDLMEKYAALDSRIIAVDDSMTQAERVNSLLAKKYKWLITTRVDNDDAIQLGCLREVQEAFREKREFLDFPAGFCLDISTCRTTSMRFKGPGASSFVSLVEPINSRVDTVCSIEHGNIREARALTQKTRWIRGIHGRNIINSMKGKECKLSDSDLRSHFGFGFSDIRGIKRSDVVIYTAIMGGYDTLKQPKVNVSCRMVCFTDSDVEGGAWEVVKVERKIDDPCREARWYKTHAHELFPDADVTIWIDGSKAMKVDLSEMVDTLLDKASIAMYPHSKRDCIYEEANACIKFEKDGQKTIERQVNRYRSEGYPEGNGLVETPVIVRRNSNEVATLCEMWWNEIRHGSRRDQLSFDYCRWFTEFEVSYIPGKLSDIVEDHEHIDKPMSIDVFMVKYFDHERDESMWLRTMSYLSNCDVPVIDWDNNNENVGLIEARRRLLRKSSAKVVCMMDFDFQWLCLDFDAMCSKLKEKDVAMVVPWTPPAKIDVELEWEEKSCVQCSVMLVRRDALDKVGGLSGSFNTAYGDWDLISRLWDAGYKVIQHNGSVAVHAPLNKNDAKKKMWDKDLQTYIAKYGQKLAHKKRPPRVVVVENNETYLPDWLRAFHDYLSERGWSVRKISERTQDVSWWKKKLSKASLVFVWDSTSASASVVEACKQMSISFHVLEKDKIKSMVSLTNTHVPVSKNSLDRLFADILGGRMEETMGHSEAPWDPLDNSAIIVISCRNCEKFIGKCADSIAQQTWADLGVIIVDDCSDDRTAVVAREHLHNVDHLVIKTATRRWAICNIEMVVSSFCSNENSVIFLADGNDCLASNAAIEEMMQHHANGQDVVWRDSKSSTECRQQRAEIDQNVSFQERQCNASPLHSFKKFLFDTVDRSELRDKNGAHPKTTWNQAIIPPILEITPSERQHCVADLCSKTKEDQSSTHFQHQSPTILNKSLNIIIYDCGGHVKHWLMGLIEYLKTKGHKVRWWDHWKSDQFLKKQLKNTDLVFMWGAAHWVYKPLVAECDKRGIPWHALEVAWFPQKHYYFTDPCGINGSASIMHDDLSWVGDAEFEKLAKLREEYLEGYKWKDGDYILVPLQVESDTNIIEHCQFDKLQQFIDHVETRFEGHRICFKKHPKETKVNDKLKTKHEWVDGSFLDLAQNAKLVYGMNSTCLLEAALMGVPVVATEACYLRAHESQTERLLAALASKQIPVKETNLDYWFERLLEETPQRVQKSKQSKQSKQPKQPKQSKQTLTIIVSCFNQAHSLPLFLESMFFQSTPPQQVIVADDGSSDGVCQWIEQNAERYPFPLSYVTRRHNGYGLASIQNLAAIHATSSRILFTNADVLHCPDSIAEHIQATGVAGGVVKGIAGPKSGKITQEMLTDFQRIEKLSQQAPSGRNNAEYIQCTDPNENPLGVWGGNFSVPKEAFEAVHGFDEEFQGWGGEDAEIARRLVEQGYKAQWVTNSVAYHLDHPVRQYANDQTGSRYFMEKSNRA